MVYSRNRPVPVVESHSILDCLIINSGDVGIAASLAKGGKYIRILGSKI